MFVVSMRLEASCSDRCRRLWRLDDVRALALVLEDVVGRCALRERLLPVPLIEPIGLALTLAFPSTLTFAIFFAVASGPKYASGAGNVSSRSVDWDGCVNLEVTAPERVSSMSDVIGRDELCTIDCKRRTTREWACVRSCSRFVIAVCSGDGDGASLESTERACIGY